MRLVCLGTLLIGGIFPPYIPRSAIAVEDIAVVTTQLLLVEDGFLMKSASLSQQGARRAYAEGVLHTVGEGENLEKLARRYDIVVSTIRWANDLSEDGLIQPGDELLILPVDGVLHMVRKGQTLARIAELYGVPQERIIEQNNLKERFLIAGEELIIPGGKPIVIKPSEKHPPPVGRPPVAQEKSATPSPPKVAALPTEGVLQKPCNQCVYTQYYYPGHYAVDLQTKGGGMVFAAENGIVIRADIGWNGGYGNIIEVEHGNGLVTLYAHNMDLYVKIGDRVKRGQVIARMGNTGRVHGPTGIHIHFEVRQNGTKRNPLLYLQ